MKALVMIDSFKGSATSKDLNRAVEEVLNSKGVSTLSFLISDGGEGFIDSINAPSKKYLMVKNGDLEDELLYYSYNNNDAFIELAKVCGLSKTKIKNPLYTSTYGVGELIKDAISSGIKNIYLGIGGSSTNDLGLGLISALGANIYINEKKLDYVCGKDLIDITKIEYQDVLNLIKGVKIYTISDVKNILIGPNGASFIYAKQKGANSKEIEILEAGAINIANILCMEDALKTSSGASGGVGYIMRTIIKSKIISGIDFILKYHGIYKHTNSVDFIVTGEGKIDNQSLQGKVIDGIVSSTNKPVYALVGINELGYNPYKNLHIYPVVPNIATFEYSMNNTIECIKTLACNLEIKKPE